MSRPVQVVLGVAAVQFALVGVYLFVEQGRHSNEASETELSTAPPQAINGRMQPLLLTTRGGGRFDLQAMKRPMLLHFWATWCPPCRAELPGILGLQEEYPVDVVAVALDKEWADVDRFLGGRPASNVVLGNSAEIGRKFDVGSLPVTYLVAQGGHLRLRFEGARDWTNKAFLHQWMKDVDRR